MAKVKKTNKAAQPAKSDEKKNVAAPAAPPPAPMVDTGLAAASAAKSLVHKHEHGAATAPTAKGESESFKQLKESLHKPITGGASSGFLQNLTPAKKFTPSFKGGRQVGHNQTFGADVNRTGVPRRTGG